MSKTKFLSICIVALIALNLATLFWMKSPPPHEGPKKIIAERLHFDAAQVAEYDKLIAEHSKVIGEKEKQFAVAKQCLYNLLSGDDYTKRDSLMGIIGQLQVEFEQVHFNHFNDIKALCKGEQLKYFAALSGDLALYFAGETSGRRPKKRPNHDK